MFDRREWLGAAGAVALACVAGIATAQAPAPAAAGTPVKIVDMARDLISLSGFEPDEDIKIEFIGLRPGEKLYEELITADENAQPTQHPKILMLKGTGCDLELLNGKIQALSALAVTQDAALIRSKLQEIVPDYAPSDTAMAYKHVA